MKLMVAMNSKKKEVSISSPQNIEQEYYSGISPIIRYIYNIFSSVIGEELSEKLILRTSKKAKKRIEEWIKGTGKKAALSAISRAEKNHRRKLIKQWGQVYGDNISRLITRKEQEHFLRAAIRGNISLINDLTSQQVRMMEAELFDEWNNPGAKAISLAQRIEAINKKGLNRARLIASNEISNLHADLQIARFKTLGVEQYVWRSSIDERVRPLHQSLNGVVYDVSEATGAEGGLPPGKPVRCRCVAIPTFAASTNRADDNIGRPADVVGKNVPKNESKKPDDQLSGRYRPSGYNYDNDFKTGAIIQLSDDKLKKIDDIVSYKKLSSEDVRWANWYSSDGYKELNQYNLGLIDISESKKVSLDIFDKNIEKAISKGELKKRVTLFRGIDDSILRSALEEHGASHKIPIDTVQSTSLSQASALAFANKKVLLKINVPKGTNALNMSRLSQHNDELELLLSSNARYNIKKVYKFQPDKNTNDFIMVAEVDYEQKRKQ